MAASGSCNAIPICFNARAYDLSALGRRALEFDLDPSVANATQDNAQENAGLGFSVVRSGITKSKNPFSVPRVGTSTASARK